MSVEYAIIVKNKTRLEALIDRFNTKAQAKFYIERSGGNFEDYQAEHDAFHRSLDTVLAKLSKVIKYKIVERIYVPAFIFTENHLIVVIGQDGLVANTAKYSEGAPIVAVNPDKNRYDGILLPFDTSNFIGAVESVIENQHKFRSVTFAEAKLNDGQRLLGFNDLFIGASSHVSARYRITYQNQTEEHSSSGLIVSTPAGSTGWLSSVFNMTMGIGKLLFDLPFDPNRQNSNERQSRQPSLSQNQLFFAVREPFKSVKTQTNIVAGFINPKTELTLESFMPSNGVIFSDGMESDFLAFNSGAIVRIGIAEETATLVL